MAGIADLLGLGGAQAFSVPQPYTQEHSLTDILAGSAPPAGVATVYPTSPAPGAIAASAATANTAANNEPGILDKARTWATSNPMQAQALMQGFAAMAAGHTRGNAVMQLGQAAGVGQQYMREQTAANSELDRAKQQQSTENQLKAQDEMRKQQLADSTVKYQGQEGGNVEARTASTKQATEQSGASFDTKMQDMKTRIAEVRQRIVNAKTENELQKARIDEAAITLQIHKQFSAPMAEVALGTAQTNMYENAAKLTTTQLQNQRMAGDNVTISEMDPEQAAARLGALKGAAKPKNAQEMALMLFKDNPDGYRDDKNQTDIKKLLTHAQQLMDIQNFDPNKDSAEIAKARNSVKIGEVYIRPDGRKAMRRE